MNKKKFMIVGAAAIFLVATIMGGTMAAFQAQTTSANRISSGNIGIKLMEKTAAGVSEVVQGDIQNFVGMPEETLSKKIYVTNTKDNPLYLRVTLHKSWLDGMGTKDQEADAAFIEIITEKKDKWFIQNNDPNSEEIYFYYKEPLKAGGDTVNIMDAIKIGNIPSKDQNIYSGLSIGFELEADAIQMVGAKDAMLSEWGLEIEIHDDGTLGKVEEQ